MRKVITTLLVSFYAMLAMPMSISAQEFLGIDSNESQNSLQEEPFMYVNSSKYNMQAEWVSYMYENSSDIEGITQKYERYYTDNEFIKNQHTQYYKRLLRGHSRISYDYSATATQVKEKQNAYLKNRSTNSMKTSDQWEAVGPTNMDLDALVTGNTPGTAHVYTLQFCAGQEQHILAGTASAGLWKSSNNGENWESISSDLPITRVLATGYMPMNPSTIYLGGVNTFYKSTDGGNSWTTTGGSVIANSNFISREIMVDADQPNTVYLATQSGFFKSTDAGENFTKILNGYIYDIELHPEDDDIIYALKVVSKRTEFYRSTDGGASFTMYNEGYPIPSTTDEQKRTVLAVTPEEPDAIFALAVGKMNNGDGLVGIYKSSNQGTSWERRCCGDTDGGPASTSNPNIMEWGCSGTTNGGQYYYDLALGVNPNNSNEILTGGINLWKSDDGGVTVNCHSNYQYRESPNTYVHADIHDIKYLNGAIWIASDGGIYRSTDGAESFTKQMNGIHGTDFRGFDVAFYDENIMLGGTYHNGTMLKEGDAYVNDWVSTRSGDTKRAFINTAKTDITYDDSGIRILSGDSNIAPQNKVLSRKPNSSYTIGESSEIVFDPFNCNRFYLGQAGILYRTDNNGVTFEQVINFGSGKVTSIEVSSSLQGLIYVIYYPAYGAVKKIMRSTNYGQSWVEVTVPSSLYNNEDTWVAWDITIGSISPYKIWAVRTPQAVNGLSIDGNMLFYSSNGGETWTNVTTNALDGEFPTNIVHHVGTEDVVYIGTRRAVYYQNNNQDIQLLSSGLPAYTFSTKLVLHYRSGKLFNATQRGLFEIDLMDVGVLAIPMVDKQYHACLRDTFYFKDHSPVLENSTRQWTFTGADVESFTGLSPKVTYSSPGVYPVKLEVFSGNSSDIFESLTFIEIEDGCSIDTVVGNALTITSNSYAKVPAFEETFEEMTITAWVKRNGIIYNDAGVALHREGPNGHGLVINPDGYLSALWDDLSASFVSDLYVPYNKWSHVAMTVKPEGITLYLNGIEQFQSRTIEAKEFNEFFLLGGDAFNPSSVLNGAIDEICFYDKALTTEEIQLYMNLVHKTPPASLISYFQANNTTGDMTDRVGSSHAYLINNEQRNPSNAPVGSGCADLLEINGPGTYNFECAGVEMTFNEGDVTPNGQVSVVKINDLPNLPLPPEDQVSESYWVINNFGTNQSFTAPTNVEISGYGYVAESYLNDPESFSLYMVPNFWEYGWGAEVDQPDSLSSEENTKVIFDEVDNMNYFGKIVLGGAASPALSAWDISLDAELIDNAVRLTWEGVTTEMEYELMKSETGQDFYKIDEGQGIVQIENNEQNFNDSRLNSSVLYYKLKVKDSTGKSWETKIISVKIPVLDKLDFYPNVIQSGDQITMNVGELENVKWELYDMHGRLIKEATQNQPVAAYDISANTGQYVLKMSQSSISKSNLLIIQ